VLDPHKLPLPPQKLVEKILIYLTFLTNLFICSGVIRHWNNMPHQSPGGGFGSARPVQFSPEKKQKEEEFQSLEEALTGEVKRDLPEPEGDPSY